MISERYRWTAYGAGLGAIAYGVILASGMASLLVSSFFAIPFIYIFGGFLNGKPLESTMWIIHLFAATTWTVLGAAIGLQYGWQKNRRRAGLIALIAGATAVALAMPVFPWGMNFAQFGSLFLEGSRRNRISDRADRSPQDLDNVIKELLGAIQKNPERAYDLNDFLGGHEIPQEIADHHSAQLVSILREHGNSLRGSQPDIIQYLCRFSKAKESKDYLLELFRGQPSSLRNRAIRFLNWTNTWTDDEEIFSALAQIYEKEGDVDRSLLAAMQKVSNKLSDPYLRKALINAKTKDEYGGLASIVSRTGSNELFEVMLTRMPEFGRPAWASQKQFDEYEKWRKEKDLGPRK